MQNTDNQNSLTKIKAKPMWATVDKETNKITDIYNTRDDARIWRVGNERIVKVALQPLAFVR